MTAGSSADTTWTFSGEVAALAAGESTADDTVVQSVDSSAEDESKGVVIRYKSCTKGVQHPQVRGRQGHDANHWYNAKAKDKEVKSPEQIAKPSSSRSSSIRSRNSAKVRGRSVVVVGRTLCPFQRRQATSDGRRDEA